MEWEVFYMFKKWTNRDWFWLLFVLIGIIILLIATIFAKNIKVETNFSIISSAVSIALALVAIFFAFKQDTDNKQTLESMRQDSNKKLDNMTNILLNQKNTFDDVADKVDKSVNTDMSETKESYSYEDLIAHGEKIKNETIESFKKLYTNKLIEEEIRQALIKYPSSSLLVIRDELLNKGFDVTIDDIKNFIVNHVNYIKNK